MKKVAKVLNFSKENTEHVPIHEYIDHDASPSVARLLNNLLNRFFDTGPSDPFNKGLFLEELTTLLNIAATTKSQDELDAVSNIMSMAIPLEKQDHKTLVMEYFTNGFMNIPTEDDMEFYSSIYLT